MRKFSIELTFLAIILALAAILLYASSAGEYKLGLTAVNHGEAEFIEDSGLRHHIVSVDGAVIDTMTWCNGVPFSNLSQYLCPYDSIVNWFKPLAPCSLYEVGGMFASSGTAELFVCRYGYSSGDSSFPWPVSDNELPQEVLWTISGTGGWEEKDFREYPSDQGFILQFPGDSLFAVGFGSDSEGKPYIFYDDYSQYPAIYPDENGVFHCTQHWRITWCHDGHWQWNLRHPCEPPPPCIWCPELNMRAIVNYYEGVPPFLQVLWQRNNTWLRENIKITALMFDFDGWIAEATLHYTVNGSGDTSEVPMSIESEEGNRFLTTGRLPGPFSSGDTITYWCTCVDNDGKPNTWVGDAVKSFVIKEPQNPGAQILLVGDGSVSKQRAGYYEEVLDRLGYSYEPTWFTEENHGIDSSVVLHTYDGKRWGAIIWFGWGCGNLPRPDALESESEYPVIRYLNDGGRLLLADQDYFWKKGLPSGLEINFEPEDFAYDYLGVQSCISDPNVGDTLSLGDTTFYGVAADDPVSGSFYYDPVELHPSCVGVANWADYTEATTQGVDIFMGALSASYSSTRFQSIKGFKTAFLPWCFEAIVDCEDTSTLTLSADTLMWNILWYFFHGDRVKNMGPNSLPYAFSLSQNYPNPFNSATLIHYRLSAVSGQESAIRPRLSAVGRPLSAITLRVYNILGEEVRTLVDIPQKAGYYEVIWDGRDDSDKEVASGVYFYRLKAGEFTAAGKMVLLR